MANKTQPWKAFWADDQVETDRKGETQVAIPSSSPAGTLLYTGPNNSLAVEMPAKRTAIPRASPAGTLLHDGQSNSLSVETPTEKIAIPRPSPAGTLLHDSKT